MNWISRNKIAKENQNKVSNQSGFTLIELLVVISIIGLLASIVLVSLNGARKKSRVVKRVADMAQIQKALELYYNDNSGYPVTPTWYSECNNWGGLSSNQVIPGLVPTYMGRFPSDPGMSKTASTACYLYYSDGINYKLLDYNIVEYSSQDYLAYPTVIDPARDSGPSCSLVDGSGIWSWASYTPDAACW